MDLAERHTTFCRAERTEWSPLCLWMILLKQNRPALDRGICIFAVGFCSCSTRVAVCLQGYDWADATGASGAPAAVARSCSHELTVSPLF